MKENEKFTKIALIVVLITGIVGGCLAGVGLVFGGSVRSITGNFTNSRLYHVLRRACRDHEGPWWDMGTSIDVQLRTSEHRSMYSYVRLSIDRCTSYVRLSIDRCTATYV